MVRTQIQLTKEQATRLKEIARLDGVSMAEVIRRAVDAWVERDPRPSRRELMERAKEVCGMFRDFEGKTDVSLNHDEYYVDAIEYFKGMGKYRKPTT